MMLDPEARFRLVEQALERVGPGKAKIDAGAAPLVRPSPSPAGLSSRRGPTPARRRRSVSGSSAS
jgi:hypothetical protein